MNKNISYLENQMELNIVKLRKTLKEKYKIEVPSQCDKFLERCLRQKDGNFEKAAKLAQAMHHVISDFGNWDVTLSPSYYNATFYKIPIVCTLATRDKLGRRILVGQTKLWDVDKISFEELALAVWMMSQMAAIDEVDQKNGHVVILNMESFSLRQAFSVSHRKLLKAANWVQSGVMGRVKGVHCFNHPKIVGWVYEGVKPFLSEKIKNRIKFHKNLPDLQECIELKPTLLPKFLGGDLEVEECMDKEFMKNLLNSSAFFQDILNHCFPAK